MHCTRKINEDLYYKKENTFNVYSKSKAKKLITDKEIDFNSDISFGIYEK